MLNLIQWDEVMQTIKQAMGKELNLPRKVTRSSVLAALLILFFLLNAAIAGPDFIKSFKFKLYYVNRGDEENYFLGALMLRYGHFNIYNYDEALKFFNGREVFKSKLKDREEYTWKITYPPLMYALIMPFTGSPIHHYIKSWFFINLFLLIMSAVLLSRSISLIRSRAPSKSVLFLVTAPFLLLYSPTIDCLLQGQINIFLLFLFCALLYSYLQGKELLAGFVLALMVSIKIFPLLFLLFFAAKREWKIAGSTLLSIIAIHLLICLTCGETLMKGFLNEIVPLFLSPSRITPFPTNRSVDGLVLYFLQILQVQPQKTLLLVKSIMIPLKIVLLVFTFLTLSGKSPRLPLSNGEKASGFCLFISLTYLVLPFSWQYYHIWYIICFMILIGTVLGNEMDRSDFVYAAILSAAWFWTSSVDGLVSVWSRQTIWWLRMYCYENVPILLITKTMIFISCLYFYRRIKASGRFV
jgi:hypothetical protein